MAAGQMNSGEFNFAGVPLAASVVAGGVGSGRIFTHKAD